MKILCKIKLIIYPLNYFCTTNDNKKIHIYNCVLLISFFGRYCIQLELWTQTLAAPPSQVETFYLVLRGYWAVYYTSPQSFIRTFSKSPMMFGLKFLIRWLKLFGGLILIGWFIKLNVHTFQLLIVIWNFLILNIDLYFIFCLIDCFLLSYKFESNFVDRHW